MNFSKFSPNLLLSIILVLSLIFRITNIDKLTTFSADQGVHFLEALKILGSNWTLLGPKLGSESINGNIYLGPLYYYFLAGALFIFRLNPIGPSYIIALCSIFTIALLFLITKRYFSLSLAYVVTVLYAFNNVVIEQSRVALNPSLSPLFSLALIYSSLKIAVDNSKRIIWQILAGASAGSLFQLHYLTLGIIITSFILVLSQRKLKEFMVVMGSFLIIISPQLLFELKHSFFITKEIIRRISSQGELTKTQDLGRKIQEGLNINFSSFLKIDNAAIFLSIVFVLVLFFLKEQKKNKIIFYFFGSVFLNLILASLYLEKTQFHYLNSTQMSFLILISYSTFLILSFLKNYIFKVIFGLIIIQISLINFFSLDLNRHNGYTMPAGWNLPGVRKSVDLIRKDNPPNNFNIASTLDGDTRGMPFRYFLASNKIYPLSVEKYPEANLIYLIAKDDESQVKNYEVWEVASFKPFNIELVSEVQNGIKLYKLTK